MNQYQLKVTYINDVPAIWGPYYTREQAVAVLRQNEYRLDIANIELEII